MRMLPQLDRNTSQLSSLPLIETPYLPDTKMMLTPTAVLVGTAPPVGYVALAGREARLLVRRGLADVLTWLGEPVVNEPVLAYLREIHR
jgi:hypothetical protein